MTPPGPLTLEPIGYLQTPWQEKFGIPRQAGLVPTASGILVPTPPHDHPAAWTGIESFSHLWLVWQFHAHPPARRRTVRPPRLGGNERLGVFATRSSFRPNPLGLSLVRLESLELAADSVRLHLAGVDLLDGTPVLDVKPYLPWADDPGPNARGGFAQTRPEPKLAVCWAPLPARRKADLPPATVTLIEQTLALDPRPAWHEDPKREYGIAVAGWNLRFRVAEGQASILSIEPLNEESGAPAP
ncbi:MAG: tRNA (N6-threonylcarbamoyladenosine(37)-N6)-methyltransferase TrmO [Halothiobacillaceae bacterium]